MYAILIVYFDCLKTLKNLQNNCHRHTEVFRGTFSELFLSLFCTIWKWDTMVCLWYILFSFSQTNFCILISTFDWLLALLQILGTCCWKLCLFIVNGTTQWFLQLSTFCLDDVSFTQWRRTAANYETICVTF